MNNTVYDVDYTRLLPEPLKNDKAILALGQIIAEELQKNIQNAQQSIIYPNIDVLPEALLDILAADFKAEWYDYDGTINEKRKTIKECMLIHRYKGTKYAVETALKSIYDNVKVIEWFEYGGKPYHFKVDIYDSSNDQEKRAKILEKIRYYKNLRSVLDSVTFKTVIDTKTVLYAGIKASNIYKRIGGAIKPYGLD